MTGGNKMKSWVWAEILLYLWQGTNGKSLAEIENGLKHLEKSDIRIAACDLDSAGFIKVLRKKIYISVTGKPVCKALVALKKSLGKFWSEV